MKVEKRIGQGGFGNVDLVVLDNGERCARKEFSQNQPLSPALLANVIKRFAKEVKVQSAISHPNIVSIIGSDLNAIPPYYLMPLAESSLDDDLEKDRTLNGNFVSAISDIVSALEELHSMEIYHRDLKPQNVLRYTKDEKTTYSISDFGLISMKESNLSELTKSGMGKGSDFYTAPEIANDLRKASARSDVYSLGCILHDMVGKEPRVPFREIREDGDFGPILAACTKDDPSKRFASAKAVLDAILTVEYEPAGTLSGDSEDFLAILGAAEAPDKDTWNRLAAYLDEKAARADIAAICGRLTADRIETVCRDAPDSAKRIGLVFAEWVSGTAFNFDLSDAIANRVDVFFQNCDFETKVECLMALLELGTSHNRWYVERRFVSLCGPDMDENLAKRLVVKFHIEGKSAVCRKISHLEGSIDFERTNLHPRLVSALADLCV
ncbi:serine/threonine protein kinase [Rhizobium laguerreae]|uniref:serine/threonine protein kinase n=1 Tax=Rhizobium laguerreae TaxID=1076926 RepID=UPI001C91522C|nr:serine/threonine-protein kinase [Rhizobium laguerreae]MBY3038634.1 serine/threonine protein kinase [Rhizobium laguerreae]